MIVYVDTSIVMRLVLNEENASTSDLKGSAVIASELFSVEARRVIEREKYRGTLTEDDVAVFHETLNAVEESIDFIGVTKAVLARASLPMPAPIKTLDAIHLATALMFREESHKEVMFATHDERLALVARMLDFPVIGTGSQTIRRGA
jgi:uncharacterized protein